MESKELRIGNLLQVESMDFDGNYIIDIAIVNTLSKDGGVTLDLDDLDFIQMFTHLEDCKSIELTEEWLLKLGFEKVNHKGINGYLSANCELIYNIESKQMFSFNEVDGSVWNLTRVVFVHHLQNLFFALTGKELKYSLNSTPNKEES